MTRNAAHIRSRRERLAALGLTLVVALGAGLIATAAGPDAAGAAAGRVPAPASGPRLSVGTDALASAFRCYGPALKGATKNPVLLSHATAVSAETNFGGNYIPALTAQGYPVCTVDYPSASMGDIQVSAEYVVYAVRRMATASGRKLTIIGHSQGGLAPRWALRFWPDLRQDVSVYVAWGTPQHGSTIVDALCLPGCAPALQQMRSTSAFVAALNRGGETWGPTAYTTVSTALDEFVEPQPSASSLAGAANISVQSLCPGRVVDHIVLTYDPVVYAITMDAITHQGKADPVRISRSVCSQAVMPYSSIAAELQTVAQAGVAIATHLLLQPHDFTAPPTAAYAS